MVEVEAEAAEQVGDDVAHRVERLDVGGVEEHQPLAPVARGLDGAARGVEAARAGQRLHPRLARERRAGGEVAHRHVPARAVGARDRGHHVRLVEREPDRAAEGRVAEGRDEVVRPQRGDGAEHLHLLDGDLAVAAQQGEEVEGRVLPPIHLARLQGGRGGGGVGDDAPLDAVEARDLAAREHLRGLLPRHVGGVALVHGARAGHPLAADKPVWPAAHRLGDLGEGVRRGVPLRHHEHRRDLRQRVEEVREGAVEAELHAPVVERARLGQRGGGELAEAVAPRPALEGGDGVARAHRFAVVEAQALAQGDRDVPPLRVPDVPFGHLRLRRQVRAHAVERVVHVVAVVAGDPGRGPNRVEAGEVRVRHEAQSPRRLRPRRGGKARRTGGEDGVASGRAHRGSSTFGQ